MTCTLPQPHPTTPHLLLLCIILLLLPQQSTPQAPFIPLDSIHQAYSQFQINLILNQNRNHPIILTTVSNNRSREAANKILSDTHQAQKLSSFSILVQCDKFQWNLNHSLGICQLYFQHMKEKNVSKIVEEEGVDSYFSCQIFMPSEVKIREKGHTIMKTHNQEPIPDGKHFNYQYLAEAVRKNVPDFVFYLEDQYELNEFLQESSQFKASKQPKLLYFDQNLLAPFFLRKLSALMSNKIEVAVTDDPPLSKKYSTTFDSLIFLQYNFKQKKYEHRVIKFDEYGSPVEQIMKDDKISRYLKVRKNRDILLDFEYSQTKVYEFQLKDQINYLLTHGRGIVVQVKREGEGKGEENKNRSSCEKVDGITKRYGTLFNYVCFVGDAKELEVSSLKKNQTKLYFIVDSIENKIQISEKSNILQYLPKNSSRQKVSTETQAEHCLRTAEITERDPIFFYLNQKTQADNIAIMNYLNSLPEVTSLLYFCQIYLPDQSLVHKFNLKQNTLFTLFTPKQPTSQPGHLQKLEHTSISSFIQLKMFLRQLSIQKMLKVYETRLLNNKIQKIQSSQQMTDKCFDRKCIVALIATGRYRQQQQMKILKQLKLQYEELFRFVWIDGICHWDVPRQLKMLKKKEKVIQRSYVFFYNQKDITYSLWDGRKFWDKKELQKWIKSLRNTRKINHLKFAIDIQNKICQKKATAPKLPEQL